MRRKAAQIVCSAHLVFCFLALRFDLGELLMKNILAKVTRLTAAFMLMVLSSAQAATVTDNFSDLDDTNNPTWTHLTGDANSTGQTFDASSGAYHIAAPSNGITLSGNQYGFAGGYTGASYTDVNVMADLVQPASGVSYGIAARLNGSNAFNGLKGYAYAFEQNLSAAPGVGEMVMYKLNGLTISDLGNDGPAVRLVTLDLANKDYTLSLSIVGSTLTGSVTEVGGGVVAFQQKTDATYSSGFSGLYGLGARSTTTALTAPLDYTVDNFKTAAVPEPATCLLMACGAGMLLIRRRVR
jgi:hypothetical protein